MDKEEKLRLLQQLLGPRAQQTQQDPLVLRRAIVDPGHVNTYKMPGDMSPVVSRWLDPANGNVTKGNQVTYLIRGEATYRAMREAIATTSNDPSHFIVLAGWSVTLDFPLHDAAGLQPTMGELLSDAANIRKVKVRGIFWRQADEVASAVKRYGPNVGILTLVSPALGAVGAGVLGALVAHDRGEVTGRSILGMEGQNFEEVKFINALPGAIGILDKHTSTLVGCHHQKILVVNGDRGLIAFVGGLDVFPDRIWPNGSNGSRGAGSPYQDLHCKIEGPGAMDVLAVAVERWKKCGVPEASHDNPDSWVSAAKPVKVRQPTCSVQIGHTWGNPTCAPPMKTAKAIILKAIAAASKYIYVEDQYLVNLEAAAALHDAVPKIRHLTIVVPDWRISDMPQCTYRRRQFILKILDGLSPTDAKKVGIYCLDPPGARFTYVHSKFWIFDDECAIIGSANCNRRGWDSDSEVVAATVEEVDPWKTELTFAHRLRMDLWAKHLGVPHWQVHDGIASGVLFRQRAPTARVRPYDLSEHDGFDLDNPTKHEWFNRWLQLFGRSGYDQLWNLGIDPP